MSLVKCRECGREVSSTAKTCPHCGVAKPKPKNPRAQAIAVLITVFLVVYMCSQLRDNDNSGSSPSHTSTQVPSVTSKPATPAKPDLELLTSKWETGEHGLRYVVGTVRNNRNKKYNYVKVEITFYDENGNQVGSTLDATNNLEPGSTWRFKALILDDEATRFKVAEVSGW